MVFIPIKDLVYRFLIFETYLFLPFLIIIINGLYHKAMKKILVFFLYKVYLNDT